MTQDHNHTFTTDDVVERATTEYHDALVELHDLEYEKKKIIDDYIQELERQKMQQLRSAI